MAFAWGSNQEDVKDVDFHRRVVDTKALATELVAAASYIVVGCGVACGQGMTFTLNVALAFGIGSAAIFSVVGYPTGGYGNCAVTVSLVLGKQVPWRQGLANFFAQLLGSCLGAAVLCVLFPCEADVTKTLASNAINPNSGAVHALFGEVLMTAMLCYVVWESVVSLESRVGQYPRIALGCAIFLAHIVLLPIDGCSINPARSFAVAILSTMRSCETSPDGLFDDMWVMWVGPLLGAALATAAQCLSFEQVKAKFARPTTTKADESVPVHV